MVTGYLLAFLIARMRCWGHGSKKTSARDGVMMDELFFFYEEFGKVATPKSRSRRAGGAATSGVTSLPEFKAHRIR